MTAPLPPRSVDVDLPEKHRRKWWRKKRWIAAMAGLLIAAYPASLGPAMYATMRGWLPVEVTNVVYYPLFDRTGGPLQRPLSWLTPYDNWWSNLAFDHAQAAEREAASR